MPLPRNPLRQQNITDLASEVRDVPLWRCGIAKKSTIRLISPIPSVDPVIETVLEDKNTCFHMLLAQADADGGNSGEGFES